LNALTTRAALCDPADRPTILPTGLLSAVLIARLFLSMRIANDALIRCRPRGWFRHALLSAVPSTLILLTFEVVFLRHFRILARVKIGNRL
jgi:hypothetical protein